MKARPYAAGVAILAALLLSTAFGTTYVDVASGTPTSIQPALVTDNVTPTVGADGAIFDRNSSVAPRPDYLPEGGADATYVDIIFGTSGNQWPWSTALGTSMHFQMMYRASNINKAGSIESWAWQCYSAVPSRVFNNVTIKMCHTSLANLTTDMIGNFSGNTPVTVATLPAVTIGGGTVGAWMPMPQTSTFAYNGTSNLLIDITWQSAQAGGPTWVRFGQPGYNGRCWVWNWSSNTASYVDGMDYNVRLGFVDQANDVGVTKIISPADPLYAFGDTIWPICEVKNMGLNAQTGVPVRCIIRDSATGTAVVNEVVNVDLAVGQLDTIAFQLYVPPVSEAVYLDTMRTEMVGDMAPANDMMANKFRIAEWGSLCANYTDGVWENGTRYVTPPYDGEYLTQYTMLGSQIMGANIWLSDAPASSLPKRIRIYQMDGTGGAPGTVLYNQIHTMVAAYWPAVTKNHIDFGPPIPCTYPVIGVSYGWNLSVAQFVCTDQTPPIEVGNDWGREGPTAPWGHTMSSTWHDNSNDYGLEACFSAPLLDGSIVDITIPPAIIDSNTTFQPQIVVKNVGLRARTNIPVAFNITRTSDPTDTLFNGTGNSGPIAVSAEKPVDFPTDCTPDPDYFNLTGISMMLYDNQNENDTLVMPLFVRYYDVLVEVVSPRTQEVPGLVPVQVRLKNMGNVPASVARVDVKIEPSGYSDYREAIPAIGVGESFVVTLNPWVCPSGGYETATAWITEPEDMEPADDIAIRPITTGVPGWTELTNLPATPSGKTIKDGGNMAYDLGTDLIYASKGNKTGDFYTYNVPTATWTNKLGIPLGAEGKPPYKGSVLCSDGAGKLYLTKGNNTVGFWEYDAALNAWTQKTPVPLGSSGKKVKQGCGLAWATKLGVGAVYMLKGYRNEFHKYDPVTNSWTQLLDAPIGTASHIKWDAGSWLVADPEPGAHMLYAFKSKYHEFYTYDTDADTWSKAKTAMPIPGTNGNKKAKDGSCAAWYSGKIYAFKGGNTTEFWRYFPLGDSWKKQDDIPLVGTSGSRKKVKGGAALAGYPGTGVYAFKGNKSLEFWRYTPYEVAGAQPSRDGVTAGSSVAGVAFAIAPNPLAGGLATVRYSLPKAGLATLDVFDVAGRTVLSQTVAAGRSGTASLDLRGLEAGVYLVKVTTEGFSATQKLVVEH